MKRFAPLLGAGLLALIVAACGSATANPSGPTPSLTADSPKIVAKDIKFTTTDVSAPANKPFTIGFDNQDSAPHNVAIDAADGKNVYRGDVFSGPGQRVYSVAGARARCVRLQVRHPSGHEGHADGQVARTASGPTSRALDSLPLTDPGPATARGFPLPPRHAQELRRGVLAQLRAEGELRAVQAAQEEVLGERAVVRDQRARRR